MALETSTQHPGGSDVHLPGDRAPDPPAGTPTIPPDAQMSPPPRDGGGDGDNQ
jgi:hypothetical protein